MPNPILLPQESRASDFEKILLITAHINWLANNLSQVTTSYEWLKSSKIAEEMEFNKIHQSRLDANHEMLSETVKKLDAIREELCDYLNGCDAVADIDMWIAEPIYSIINDIDQGADEESDQPNGANTTEDV